MYKIQEKQLILIQICSFCSAHMCHTCAVGLHACAVIHFVNILIRISSYLIAFHFLHLIDKMKHSYIQTQQELEKKTFQLNEN